MLFVLFAAVALATDTCSDNNTDETACTAAGCTYTAQVTGGCANAAITPVATDPCISHGDETACAADTDNSCAFVAASGADAAATCIASGGFTPVTADACLAITQDDSTACAANSDCTFSPAVPASAASCAMTTAVTIPTTDPCLDLAQNDSTACATNSACTFVNSASAIPATCADPDFASVTVDPCIQHGDNASVCNGDTTNNCVHAASACNASPAFSPTTDPCLDIAQDDSTACGANSDCTFTPAVDEVVASCTTTGFAPVTSDLCDAVTALDDATACEAVTFDAASGCAYTALGATQSAVSASCIDTDFAPTTADPCLDVTGDDLADTTACSAAAWGCTYTAATSVTPASCGKTGGFTPVTDPCSDVTQTDQSACESSTDSCTFTAAVAEACAAAASSAAVAELLFGAFFAAAALLF